MCMCVCYTCIYTHVYAICIHVQCVSRMTNNSNVDYKTKKAEPKFQYVTVQFLAAVRSYSSYDLSITDIKGGNTNYKLLWIFIKLWSTYLCEVKFIEKLGLYIVCQNLDVKMMKWNKFWIYSKIPCHLQ